jgi:hypothetical protein
VILAAAAAVHYGGSIQHRIANWMGLTDPAGVFYSWWSGIASDAGEYVIAVSVTAGVIHAFRRHNCREHGCWRIGIHTWTDADGHPHPVCRVHHPTIPRDRHFHFAEMHRHKMAVTTPPAPAE